jgi:hypothetical protein
MYAFSPFERKKLTATVDQLLFGRAFPGRTTTFAVGARSLTSVYERLNIKECLFVFATAMAVEDFGKMLDGKIEILSAVHLNQAVWPTTVRLNNWG